MSGLLWVALLAVGLAPSSDDNELTAKSEHARSVEAARQEVYALRWRRSLVRTGIHRNVGTNFGGPVIVASENLVVAGTGDGNIWGLDLGDGSKRWRYNHGSALGSTASLVSTRGEGFDPDLVVLGTLDGVLVAVDVATGRPVWRAALDGNSRAPVRQYGDRLYTLTSTNKVFAIDAASGRVAWSKGRPASASLTIDGQASPLVAGDLCITTFSDGYVEAYKAADGAMVWSRPLSMGFHKFVDADADPVVSGGLLLVASYSDGIYALNLNDGQTVWQRPAPAVVSLTVAGDVLVVGSADGWVWGLANRDGHLLYRTRLPGGHLSRFWADENWVIFSAGEAGLVVLETQTGKPLQSYDLGATFSGDVAVTRDHVAVTTNSGQLVVLKRRSDLQPPS